ncbi:MAG: TldD/PmbA family protein, partial [Myxococcales bacterium]|nr:TldD/PmbA family protein [Polyangiaceae bacterium]MDW8249249.1 TldD/PmbA family protein [Myxococcales bacterium]
QRRARSLRSGASFWSLRYTQDKVEYLSVRDGVVQPLRQVMDQGVMVTALAGGGCGYAATSDLSEEGLQKAMDRAEAWARASSTISLIDFNRLRFPSPRGYVDAHGEALPNRRDVLDLLRSEAETARFDSRIVDVLATAELRETEEIMLTSAGGETVQRSRFVIPNLMVTASEGCDAQTRSLGGQYNGACRQGGAELLERSGLRGAGRRIAEEALALLAAPRCPEGTMSVLLMPDQMMLQIHESIGHPIELDRILGDERNYAGTTFVKLEMFGRYRYGSELLNVTYDPTDPAGFASFVFDAEGGTSEKVYLIREGILLRPLGGFLSQQRARLPGVATARACSWNRPPIDRMSNLNIEPGTSSLDDMIASVERGILMKTNTSWSIDDSRNKFQFGCEWGQLIENGKLGAIVRNPNYRGVSTTFWQNLVAVGNRSSYELNGTPFCGKGEPSQLIRVGHASPACLFREVEVFGGST